MKELILKDPWTGEDMKAMLSTGKYSNNHRMFLSVLTWDNEWEFWEPWCNITVNLPDKEIPAENFAFVDTNNAPYIAKWLVDNKFARYTEKVAFSGYCQYPLMEFDMEAVKKHV